MRPTASFLLAHPAHFIALGFGTGLAPAAPGTVGSLLAIPLYQVLAGRFTPLAILLLCVPLFLLGIWACARTGRDLGESDHPSITWDEVVAMLFVLCFVPPTLPWQLAAFGAFRFFDIVKPPPVRHIDARVKGGFGAMLDDLFAAFYALFVMAVVKAMLD